jgi:zinc/manganese transport system substrate-binding protein
MKKMRAKIGVALLAAALLLVAGCGGAKQTAKSPAAQGHKIKVVAAENFYGEVAKAVGGDQVEVTSILANPQQDPHDYEPTAAASRQVADSQVMIYTGLGYDDWAAKLLKADSNSSGKEVVAVGGDLLGKKAGDNPHVWYDPAVMPKLAKKLADDFAKIDPEHARQFQQRANDYIATLAPLTDKVAKLRQAAATNIDVSEPVFDYMAAALNFTINDPAFAKAVEDGNDPAVAEYAKVQGDITGKKIKFFVCNMQTESPTVERMVKLAEANGIPVIKVTETEPAGKNYLQWMTGQLEQIEKALNK